MDDTITMHRVQSAIPGHVCLSFTRRLDKERVINLQYSVPAAVADSDEACAHWRRLAAYHLAECQEDGG